ncbi:hypothetical protein HAINFHK1212_0896 [Haemophilus influenzae HK1212]|uniref:Uncharacterized protein n=1 Tax=Haemophilus influenzae HK1212 TaxID=456482 RepID=A0A7G2K014_HAEIF|nr:hypothetical protein HAINFHK1212_0896 [Haemophilus influenzae HK1212]
MHANHVVDLALLKIFVNIKKKLNFNFAVKQPNYLPHFLLKIG